jgi:hypothetical protein
VLRALNVIHFWFDPVAIHYGAYKGDNFDRWTVPVSVRVVLLLGQEANDPLP